MATVTTPVRRSVVLASMFMALLLAIAGAGPAAASPIAGPQQASCVYNLSKPFVTEVSGVKMVSATLSSLPCIGNFQPNSQTVCVALEGSSDPSQCAYMPGYNAAQVFFAPYRAGSTYVSTGTGCGAVAPSLVSACATQGPSRATL